jgi:hypothetical protein
MAAEEINLYKFVPPGGIQDQLVGGVLALGTNGTTLTPTTMVHHVSGTSTALSTITPPWSDYTGPLYLIADAVFVATTGGGNIGTVFTTVANNAYGFLYDRVAAKWYPLR